jgi:hypothetical protein
MSAVTPSPHNSQNTSKPPSMLMNEPLMSPAFMGNKSPTAESLLAQHSPTAQSSLIVNKNTSSGATNSSSPSPNIMNMAPPVSEVKQMNDLGSKSIDSEMPNIFSSPDLNFVSSPDRNDGEKKKNVSEMIEESDGAMKLELDSEESKTKPNDGTDTSNKQGPNDQKKGGGGTGGGGALAAASALLMIRH